MAAGRLSAEVTARWAASCEGRCDLVRGGARVRGGAILVWVLQDFMVTPGSRQISVRESWTSGTSGFKNGIVCFSDLWCSPPAGGGAFGWGVMLESWSEGMHSSSRFVSDLHVGVYRTDESGMFLCPPAAAGCPSVYLGPLKSPPPAAETASVTKSSPVPDLP